MQLRREEIQMLIAKRGNQMNDNANVHRRSLLKGVALLLAAAAVVPASKRAFSASKASQEAGQYQDKPNGEKQCDNYLQFVPPGSCKVVEGSISPKGYCTVWVAKA
jgi:hypothetical protein